MPSCRDGEDIAVEQLVLPKECHDRVISLAHSIALAGHLGWDKMTQCILQQFYWPTIYRDVAEYCWTCGSCQKVAQHPMQPAPLIPSLLLILHLRELLWILSDLSLTVGQENHTFLSCVTMQLGILRLLPYAQLILKTLLRN